MSEPIRFEKKVDGRQVGADDGRTNNQRLGGAKARMAGSSRGGLDMFEAQNNYTRIKVIGVHSVFMSLLTKISKLLSLSWQVMHQWPFDRDIWPLNPKSIPNFL